MTVAVCPGSFDPPTLGHLRVFERTASLFDQVVVAVIANPSKRPMFDLGERVALVERVTEHLPNARAEGFEGLLVDFARRCGASAVVKGLRGAADVDYETQMAQMNHHLSGLETVFLPSEAATAFISSSLVREIAGLGGRVDTLVPAAVAEALKEKLT
jgi:pantetheine-phosphate adenylyltransferase